MAQYYTIESVSSDTREWRSKYGKDMISYKIMLNGDDGFPFEAEVNQLATTPPPAENQKIFGWIDQTEYGLKFNKQQDDKAAPQQSTQTSHTAPSRPASNQTDDMDRQRMIIRQSSLKAAVDFHGMVKGEVSKQDVLETARYFADWAETGEWE